TDSPVVWGCASIPARPRARSELLLRDVSDRELASQADDESGPLQDVVADVAEDLAAAGEATGTDLAGRRRARQPTPTESARVVSDIYDDGELPEATETETTRRAIALVRALPALDGLHKGRHLRHVERSTSHLLALSFSGIYILCLVFDGDFDELRAERAAGDALPRIERLVQALPPLDPNPPQPMGGVVALR